MESLTKKLKCVYVILADTLLAAACAYMLSIIWGFKVHPAAIIAVSFIMTVYVKFIAENKNGWLFILLPAVIIAIICTYAEVNILSWFIDAFSWSGDYWLGNSKYTTLYAYTMTLTVSVPITAAAFFLNRNYAVRTIMSVLIFAGSITATVIKQPVPKFVAFSAIIYVLLSVIETVILINNKKRDSAHSFNSAAFLFPVAVAAVMLSVAFPSGSEPINWSFMQKIYNTVHERAEIIMTEIQYIIHSKDSEFSVSGYSDSESATLGGNISDNDSTILYMSIPKKTNGNTYLTGSVKNEFNGSSWSNSYKNNSGYSEFKLDYLEFLYSLYRNDISPKDLVTKRETTLTYYNIKTKTLFYPIKSYDISVNNPKKIDFTGGGIHYNTAKGEKNTYSVSFYDIDFTSNAFNNLVTDTDNTSYDTEYNAEEFNQFVGDFMSFMPYNYISNKNSDLPSVLKTRQENIYASYLNIPDTIPQRVYDLADEITEGYNTDYDKLKAIEEYLNTNYTYTKSPMPVPEGRDFVDYFLFDSKQGYCTYFATSMAILGRAEGIPMRYVEGVIEDYSKTVKIHTYSITGNNAHAWAEAYLKGVGWVPFEPTSSYYSKRYSEPAKPYVFTNVYNPEKYNIPQENQQEETLDTIEQKETKLDRYSVILMIVLSVFSALILIALYYYIIRYRYRCKSAKSDPKQAYRLCFTEILYYLSIMGYNIGQSETVQQFAVRIADMCDENIKAVADTYAKLRFSSAVPQKQDYYEAVDLLNVLTEQTASKKGRLKMFFYRIRLYNT